MTTALMDVTTTPDGVAIASWRSGTGDPLVLVHGSTADHTRWKPVLPALEAHRTVHAVDRRGRGGSGDGKAYTLAAEFADIAAVVDAAAAACGRPVDLLGHSYGAICALEAARLSDHVRRLVLYEPPLVIDAHPPGLVEDLRRLLREGRREDVVTTFMRRVVGVDEQTLATMRSAPAWPSRVAAAHTLVRELRVDDGYTFHPSPLGTLTVPTLLLVGSDSRRFLRDSTEALAQALPNRRIVELPGQGHIAIDTAPSLFTDAVLSFLVEVG